MYRINLNLTNSNKVKFLCAYFKCLLWMPGRAREDYWTCYVMERAPSVNVARPQVTRSSEFRVLGSEVEASDQVEVTPLRGTALKRKHQDQTFCRRFHKDNRHGNEAQTVEPPASRRERGHTELSLGADTQKEDPDQPKVLTQPVRTSFTSFLSFRFSSSRSSRRTAAELEPKPSKEPHSLPEVLKTNRGPGDKQVNGRTHELLFPAKNEEQVVPSSVKSRLSRDLLHKLGTSERPDGLQSNESTEDAPMSLAQSHGVDIAEPTAAMLSSTMVSVLAPIRSTRPRRTKRDSVATEDLDDHGNAQNVPYGTNGSQHVHVRESTSFLGTRRTTAGWSTMSGPPSVNVDCVRRRPASQSVALDVHSDILDNRGKENCASNTVPRTEPRVSSLSLTLHETRGISQAAHQGKLSSSRSKPGTSSLLLSLRKLHSNWRHSSLNPTLSVANPCTNSNRGTELSTPNPLPTSPNNNEQEQWNSLPCSPTFNRIIDTNLMNVPTSPNRREADIFSSSSINRDPEKQPSFSRNLTSPNLLYPRKQIYLMSAPSETQNKSIKAEEMTATTAESPVSSSRLSQYDRYAFLKSQTLPRGTTLRATSWWKQGNSLGFSDETNLNQNNNETSTPVFAPCNLNTDSTFTSTNDKKRFGFQIHTSEDNNTTAQLLHKGITNTAYKTEGGASVLMQNKARDTPGQSSGRFLKQPDDSSLNNRVAQRPRSLPSFSFKTKISSATGQSMLTHPEGLSKAEVSNNVTELPLTLSKPKSQNIPSESVSNKVNRYIPSTASHTSVLSESSSGSKSHPLSLKVHNPATSKPQLLGFERTYPPIHKSIHPKLVSTLISTAHVRLSSNPSTSLLSCPKSSPSPTSPPATAITTSFLLTPPATPTHPHSPKSSCLGAGERTFSGGLDLSPETVCRRSVAGQASRALQQDSLSCDASDKLSREPEPLRRSRTSPASSPPGPTPSVETPSIFSVLRAGSPSESTSPRPTPKTTGIQSWRGGESEKIPSTRSSDQEPVEGRSAQTDATDRRLHLTFDHGERALTSPGTVSGEARRGHCRSLSSDFVSGYNFRYSTPPYLTLKSTQSSEGHAKNAAAVTPRFSEASSFPKSPADLQLPLHSDPPASKMSYGTVMPQSCISSCQAPSDRRGLVGMLTLDSTVKDSIKDKSFHRDGQNSQDIISQPLPIRADKASNFPSTCVVETVIYRLSKVDSSDNVGGATPLINHSSNTQVSMETEPHQSSNGHRSEEGNECSNKKIKKSGAARFFPLQSKKEILPLESPNKVFSTTKKTESTPNNIQETAFLPDKGRPETGRTQKSTKIDQVFSRLKQAFGSRNCEDDFVKYKQAPMTSSVNGSSIKAVTNKTVERSGSLTGEAVRISDTEVEKREKQTENRYTLITSSEKYNVMADCQFPNWPGKTSIDKGKMSTSEDLQVVENALTEPEPSSECEIVAGSTSRSPVLHQCDIYGNGRVDYKPTNQSLCRDLSNARQQYGRLSYFATFPMKRRSSTASSRSPLSPYAPVDDADDSVFYSPKIQHRNEFTSLWEPVGDGRDLPPATGGDPADTHSSCADLKYGIEARRSISVSSVLSSRPSGPGRISTGLSPPAALVASDGRPRQALGRGPADQWTPAGQRSPPKSKCQSVGDSWGDSRALFTRNDPRQTRSRSLPRSLASSSFSWGADTAAFPIQEAPARGYTSAGVARSPISLTCSHAAWATEGPPTPPLSPPCSPPSRRISKPCSLSSSSSPCSPGSSQDSQSPRGHLPSRGYMTSLSAFEESSDSSSDTTTDDEYYLEAVESEMETEL